MLTSGMVVQAGADVCRHCTQVGTVVDRTINMSIMIESAIGPFQQLVWLLALRDQSLRAMPDAAHPSQEPVHGEDG